jgi:hypothetical protein
VTNFESNPLRRNRRARPALSARSLGCACLILIAFAPQIAMAQTPGTLRLISVTLPPGERTTSIQAPRDASFVVALRTPLHVCGVPYTVGEIERRIAYWDRQPAPGLQGALSRMESYGTSSGGAIVNAFAIFTGLPVLGSGSQTGISYQGGQVNFTQAQLAGGPFTHTFRAGCHTVDEARTILNEIRRGIRAYLGMPAPAN